MGRWSQRPVTPLEVGEEAVFRPGPGPGTVATLVDDSHVLALQEGREPDYSEYKEFKLTVENIGYQMLMKMGWKEGDGLGSEGQGIKNPVNK